MSLKVKLISCISAVVLVIGLMIFGVFSVERASVNLGGTVSFEATNVYCRITGQITGAEESPVTPQELNYSANSEPTEEQLASWNNDLNFTEDAQAIEIEVTVENLATRELIVSVDDLTTSSNNVLRSMTKTVGEASENYTSGSLYTIPASTGEGSANTSKATFTLKLEVDDPNNSASATYNYRVNLRDESVPVIIDDNNGSDNMGSITIEDENGDGKIEAGEEVTVTADPNVDSDFIGWQDENGIVVSEDEEFTFTAGEDFSNITALFNKTISSSVKDESTTSPLIYTIYNEAEVAEVTGCDVGAVDVTIPETITRDSKSYIVYKIKDVTSSSNGAFYQTRSTLESVVISDKITKIGQYAFRDCSKLTEINWGENVREIGRNSFQSCSGLTSLVFPSGLRSIAGTAFNYCSNINNIILNEGLEELTRNSSAGYGAFGYTKIATLHIPASAKMLEENIVAGCSTIQTITVDASNPYYEDRGLNVIIGKADSPNTSERNMLKSTTNNIKSIPEGVTSIERNAFARNDSLTSIIIPSSVTYIAPSAFYNCNNLNEVTIESKNIYKTADDITVNDAGGLIANAQIIRILKTIDDGSNAFLINNYDKSEGGGEYAGYNIYTAPVEVTQDGITYKLHNSSSTGSVSGYESTLNGDVVIPSSISYDSKTYSVTVIEEDAFDSCDITSITIPDSVTSIGRMAFSYCDKLVSVIFAGTPKITEISYAAFFSCDALESINIPSSVTRIQDQAFEDCSSLTSITIPSGVTSIGSWSFNDCSSLTEINVDENNANYSDIDGVLFNKTQTEIVRYPEGKEAASYDFPESVTSIRSSAFYGCSYLTSITIPSSVTSIEGFVFSRCSNLTSITIPSSVTEIGGNAFSYCSSLTNITIPSSVTSIGGAAFYGCSSLTSITIPSSVTDIGSGSGAFNGCTNLKTVYCDSVRAYTSADSNSSGSTYLFNYADTVYILASIRDGGATNFYLNDTTTFNIPSTTTNVNGQDYYVYTRK